MKTIKALRACSCITPGFEFDLVKFEVKTVPDPLAKMLIVRGYAEIFDEPNWTLHMHPSTYLRMYPTGKNAELARKVLKMGPDDRVGWSKSSE